jgi:hypothetical protein
VRGVELRARAYRLLVRRQGDRDFDFYRHSRAKVRSFLAAPLKDTQVALVTTAGLFHRPSGEPFSVAPGRGDPTFRELRAAEIDLEVVYPIGALGRARDRGVVGSVCSVALSLHGHIPEPDRLFAKTAPLAAQHLRRQGAGAALIVGACALGAQSAGLTALAFETEGIPTVVVTQWPQLASEAGASRTLGSPFPFGMTMGPPLVEPLHDWILGRALARLTPRLAG